jgi:D-serine deaminase-like pyridoxal phosphate-dependent protein
MGSPVTEQRPGTYVFGDHQQTCIGSVDTTDVAAMVIATVIHSSDQRVVIDAGAKILTKDRADYLDSYGLVVGHGQATIERVYDNHGVLAWPDTDDRPAVGTRLAIVPNHICPVIHQVDEAMLVTGAIHRPLAIDLRGHLN